MSITTCALLILVACGSEENNDTTTVPKGMTAFTVSNLANSDARTSGVYGTSRIDFYWSTGDNIWINTSSTTTANYVTTTSNSITTSGTLTSANFYLQGQYSGSSYPVRYTGNASTSADVVTISSSQTQVEANNAAQMGEVGDCGVGTAVLNTSGTYDVTLAHKASYLTFIPYYSTEELASSVVLTNITVTAGTDDVLAGTYAFTDAGLGTASNTSNTVTLNLVDASSTTGFNIPTSATAATNAAMMVVAPGTYSTFKIEYALYDATTGFSGTVTRTYSNIILNEGRNNKIAVNLSMNNYSDYADDYYMWDAVDNYWKGYESSQPTLTNGSSSNYPQSSTDSRWFNTSFTGTTPTMASRSCQNAPTYEALTWYVSTAASPAVDNTTLWTYKNHLYTGGMWLKKSSAISGFSSSSNASGSQAWSTGYDNSYSISISGKPSDATDYFFLPALGQYVNGVLSGVGKRGYYWSSSPNPYNSLDIGGETGKVISAACLRFATDASSGNVYVRAYYERNVGMQVYTFE